MAWKGKDGRRKGKKEREEVEEKDGKRENKIGGKGRRMEKRKEEKLD